MKYARWLVCLRKALLSTGCFENGVYPCSKSWRHYYDSGYSPFRAAKEDTGISPSGFYMEWNGKT
jgi:hypothetical protein